MLSGNANGLQRASQCGYIFFGNQRDECDVAGKHGFFRPDAIWAGSRQ